MAVKVETSTATLDRGAELLVERDVAVRPLSLVCLMVDERCTFKPVHRIWYDGVVY